MVPPYMEQYSGDLLELAGRVIALQPKLRQQESLFRDFCRLLEKLMRVAGEAARPKAIETAREEIESIGSVGSRNSEIAVKFACSVVVDVVAQGWEISVTRD